MALSGSLRPGPLPYWPSLWCVSAQSLVRGLPPGEYAVPSEDIVRWNIRCFNKPNGYEEFKQFNQCNAKNKYEAIISDSS